MPLIRGGDSNETDLTKLVGSYELSVFNKNFIKAFFDARNLEVGSIQNVLNRAKNEPSVVVDYGSSSNGNKCLQVRSHKIEYTQHTPGSLLLRILVVRFSLVSIFKQ